MAVHKIERAVNRLSTDLFPEQTDEDKSEVYWICCLFQLNGFVEEVIDLLAMKNKKFHQPFVWDIPYLCQRPATGSEII